MPAPKTNWEAQEGHQYQTYLSNICQRTVATQSPLFNPAYGLSGVVPMDKKGQGQKPVRKPINVLTALCEEGAKTMRLFWAEPTTSAPNPAGTDISGMGKSFGTGSWEVSIGEQSFSLQRENVVMSNQVARFDWESMAAVEQGERIADWFQLVALGHLAGLTCDFTGTSWTDRGKGAINYSQREWSGIMPISTAPPSFMVYPGSLNDSVATKKDENITSIAHKLTPLALRIGEQILRDRHKGVEIPEGGIAVLCSEQQWAQLLTDPNFASVIVSDASYAGLDRSPYLTGEAFRYLGMRIIPTQYTPPGQTSANVAAPTVTRAIMMGSNALTIAWGQYNKGDVSKGDGIPDMMESWTTYSRESQIAHLHSRLVVGMTSVNRQVSYDTDDPNRCNRIVLPSWGAFS